MSNTIQKGSLQPPSGKNSSAKKYQIESPSVSEESVASEKQPVRKGAPAAAQKGAGMGKRRKSTMLEQFGPEARSATEGSQGPKEFTKNQKMSEFVERYGVEVEIPAKYIHDCKIYPMDPSYLVQVVGFCFPSAEGEDEYIIKKHRQDGGTEESTCADFYGVDPRVSLRLMRQQDDSLVPVQIAEESESNKNCSDVPVELGRQVNTLFSPDGRYMVIHLQRRQIIRIYKIHSDGPPGGPGRGLEGLFKRLLRGEPPSLEFSGPPWGGLDALRFDQLVSRGADGTVAHQCRYLACYDTERVRIIDLKGPANQPAAPFELPSITDGDAVAGFEAILDVQLRSKERPSTASRNQQMYGRNSALFDDDEPSHVGPDYDCMIVAKKKGEKRVQFFNIDDDREWILTDENALKRSISYKHDLADLTGLRARISHDFQRVVLITPEEHYQIVQSEEPAAYGGGDSINYFQTELAQLNHKNVHYILPVNISTPDSSEYSSQFYFVCCNDYDQTLDILCTHDPDAKQEIQRNVQPGSTFIYDMMLQAPTPEPGPQGARNQLMHLLSNTDEEFFVDIIDMNSQNPRENGGLVELDSKAPAEAAKASPLYPKQFYLRSYSGFSSQWPYIAFQCLQINQTQQQNLWIVNANDQRVDEDDGRQQIGRKARHLVHEVEIPLSGGEEGEKSLAIACTYITENYELYLVQETQYRYILSSINLQHDKRDGERQFKVVEHFRYLKDDILRPQSELGGTLGGTRGGRRKATTSGTALPLTARHGAKGVNTSRLFDVHVRTASIQSNKKLQAFFLHKNALFTWLEGTEDLQKVTDCNSIGLQKVGDDSFLFRAEDRALSGAFELKQLFIEFSSYSLETIYKQDNAHDSVKAYAYDFHERVLILNLTSKQENQSDDEQIRFYDLENYQLLLTSRETDHELFGRVKSRDFILLDGHLYFNNSIIKLRYDILRSQANSKLSDIASIYNKVLDLEEGEMVNNRMPIISDKYHKLVYMTKNQPESKAKKLKILPYLHERKVYLSEVDPNTDFYNTTISREKAAAAREAVEPVSKEEEAPSSGDNDPQKVLQRETLMVRVNITNKSYLIYQENGILVKQVSFADETVGYQLETVSNDGLVLAYRNLHRIRSGAGSEHGDSSEVHYKLLKIGREGAKVIEPISVKEKVRAWRNSAEGQQEAARSGAGDDSSRAGFVDAFLRASENGAGPGGKEGGRGANSGQKYKIKIKVNDSHDTMLRIQQGPLSLFYIIPSKPASAASRPALSQPEKQEAAKQRQRGEQTKDIVLFITERGGDEGESAADGAGQRTGRKQDSVAPDKHVVNGEPIHFPFEIKGFALNPGYAFIWTSFNIWCLRLVPEERAGPQEGWSGLLAEEEPGRVILKKLKLDLSSQPSCRSAASQALKSSNQTQIFKVKTGSCSQRIMIFIGINSSESRSAVTWDVGKDKELCLYDVSKLAQLFWDSQGSAYITEKDITIITDQGVKLKCFLGVQPFNDQYEGLSKTQVIGSDYGHRFDDRQHSWIFLSEYISISYSYMTFVIQNSRHSGLEQGLESDAANSFDLEAYNYLFNRKTIFTDLIYQRKESAGSQKDPGVDEGSKQMNMSIANDSEKLAYILGKFEQLDATLLQQIQYFHEEEPTPKERTQGATLPAGGIKAAARACRRLLLCKRPRKRRTATTEPTGAGERGQRPPPKKVTPLHLAFRNHEQTCIQILLKYMAKIDYNASDTFKDILPFLIENDGILGYLEALQFQTIQMENKQSLKVESVQQDKIVRLATNISSFLDSSFFSAKMAEDVGKKSYKSYPVKVQALKINWILNSEDGESEDEDNEEEDNDGKKFLMGILRSENNDLFLVPSVRVLIEYLFSIHKQIILRRDLAVYIGQLMIFFVTIYLYEGKYTVASITYCIKDDEISWTSWIPDTADPGARNATMEACRLENDAAIRSHGWEPEADFFLPYTWGEDRDCPKKITEEDEEEPTEPGEAEDASGRRRLLLEADKAYYNEFGEWVYGHPSEHESRLLKAGGGRSSGGTSDSGDGGGDTGPNARVVTEKNQYDALKRTFSPLKDCRCFSHYSETDLAAQLLTGTTTCNHYVDENWNKFYVTKPVSLFILKPNEKDYDVWIKVFAILNLVSSISVLLNLFSQFLNLGKQVFHNHWTYMEAAFCILNLYISARIYENSNFKTALEVNEKGNLPDLDDVHIKEESSLRVVEAFIAILIWNKSLYFMSLVNEIAPLVTIIFKVFYDILNFMLVLAIVILAFANSFYLIGKNQAQFDDIENVSDYPLYFKIEGALQYVYLISLGETGEGDDNYIKGNNPSSQIILWVLFVLLTFTVCIHLLNMLIAIMGETFTENNEVAEQNRIREHLRFVMDHWYKNPPEIKNKDGSANYLVSALLNEEPKAGSSQLQYMEEEMSNLSVNNEKAFETILTDLRSIRNRIYRNNK